jgi:hypothetical protein
VALFIAACFWLGGLLFTAAGRNFLTMPLFAVVLCTFAHPTRRTLASCAAAVVLLPLLFYAAVQNVWGVVTALGLGLLPALLIGATGRVVAWARNRDVVPTILGGYFGFPVGLLCGCCGASFIFVLLFGQENLQRVQRYVQEPTPRSDAEAWAFLSQFDWAPSLVFSIAWVLLSILGSVTLGALLGAAAAGRKPIPGERLARGNP